MISRVHRTHKPESIRPGQPWSSYPRHTTLDRSKPNQPAFPFYQPEAIRLPSGEHVGALLRGISATSCLAAIGSL